MCFNFEVKLNKKINNTKFMSYLPNSSWFTRMNGLNLNGQHPTEGWGIFKVDNHLEVQKIDEENKLSSDVEAMALAKKKGIRFSKTNPFEDMDDDNFQCCVDCDLPDACRDFGCAIKAGIVKRRW